MAQSSLQVKEAELEAEARLRAARRRMWLDRLTSLGALIAIVVIATILIGPFSTPRNLINVLRQASVNALLASGMTFVILTGGIDLSVGSQMALVGVISVGLMSEPSNWNPWLASVLGIVLTAVIGAFMGFWIIGWKSPKLERAIMQSRMPLGLKSVLSKITQKTEVPPFIVTLAGMLIIRGIGLWISEGQPRLAPKEFGWLGQESIGPIPVPVIATFLVYIICYFILSRTKFGRSVYAVGGNKEVARLSGININSVLVRVYGLCGLLAGLAGIVLASRMGSGQVNVGNGDELNAIAAVIIGGTSFSGGEGGIWGTLIGALIIAIILNILNLLGVPSYGQYIARGLVILVAVYLDSSIRR